MEHFDSLEPEWGDALFEAAPTAMAIVGPDHRFVRCNAAFSDLTGFSRSELLARTWQSITHPDDVAGDQAGADAAQHDSGHPTYTVTKRYLSKRGDAVWVNLHVRGIWHKGAFQCYFITALRQAPARCEDCPANGRRTATRETVVEWCKRNPKDAAIMFLAGAAFLGRDEAVAMLKALVK